MEDEFTLFVVRDFVLLFHLLYGSNKLLSAQNTELRWIAVMNKTVVDLGRAIEGDQVYS